MNTRIIPSPTIADLGFQKYAEAVALDLEATPVEHIARVIEEHRTRWILMGNAGQIDASIRGTLHYDLDTEAFPKVGDWVVYTPLGDGKGTIETILPRVSKIVRKEVHGLATQIIVTNVDTIAIVQGADQEFNRPKIERYLEIARQSGVAPLVVLTKSDMATDLDLYMRQIAEIAPSVPVVAISSLTGEGVETLSAHMRPAETTVLLGASGAGKSTLLNTLMQRDIQDTQAVRKEDAKGMHTTTRRSLFILPSGGLIIDTPGMRELTVIDEEEKKDIFEDVAEIAFGCRFSNCDHEKSIGCAVRDALENGSLDQKRYQGYVKFLQKQKKAEEKTTTNNRSQRIKSNRAALNYESRRQSEE